MVAYNDLLKRLSDIVEQNHVFYPNSITEDCLDIESIPHNQIDFFKFIKNHCERWSISEDDFFVFNNILKIENKKILELGRFFGLSSAAFCCNHDVELTSIDDNSCDVNAFSRLSFFNISEFLLTDAYEEKGVISISIKNKLVDKISKSFLKDYNIKYIDDKFSKKYLTEKYDFIFEDLVGNPDNFSILESCLKFLDFNPNCIIIMHDDLRFPFKHKYLENIKYITYDSEYFQTKYNISPNLALIAKNKIPYLKEI